MKIYNEEIKVPMYNHWGSRVKNLINSNRAIDALLLLKAEQAEFGERISVKVESLADLETVTLVDISSIYEEDCYGNDIDDLLFPITMTISFSINHSHWFKKANVPDAHISDGETTLYGLKLKDFCE